MYIFIKYHNVINLSKYIINYCKELKASITNLKLIKILYLVNVDYYELFDEYLFPKEYIDFKSWKILGPYIPAVWNHYKYYTSNELPRQRDYIEVVRDDDAEILNTLLDNYIDCSTYRLVQLSKRKHFYDEVVDEEYSAYFS